MVANIIKSTTTISKTGTDKNTPKPGHGHNPAMTNQTWEGFI